MIEFKHIINNVVLRDKIFSEVKNINGLTYNKKYKWDDVYRSFKRLAFFNCTKELKYRLENEGIDDDIHALRNTVDWGNKKKKIKDYVGGTIDHRVVGLGEIASKRGNLSVIQYLHQYQNKVGVFRITDMEIAIRNGHLECALFLYHNRVNEEGYGPTAISEASKKGYNELLELLLKKWNCQLGTVSLDMVGKGTTLETLKILHKYGWVMSGSEESCNFSSLEMIKFVSENFPQVKIHPVGQRSNVEDRLDIIRYIHNSVQNTLTIKRWMELLSRTGKLDALKFLTEKNQIRCTSDAMTSMEEISIPMIEYLRQHHNLEYRNCVDSVIAKGDLETLIYLIDKGVAQPPLLKTAAFNNQLEIMKYLHSTVKDSECPPHVMDTAARLGFLDIVKFLHNNRTEGCTQAAMTGAIQYNNMEMVKFLHENRTEGYEASKVEHIKSVEMIEFLLKNRKEGFGNNFLRSAFRSSNIELVKYVHNNPNLKPTQDQNPPFNITLSHNLEVVKFLHENRTDVTTIPSSWNSKVPILSYLIDNRSNDDSLTKPSMNTILTSPLHISIKRLHHVCRILKIKGWEYNDEADKRNDSDPEDRKFNFTKLETIKYAHLFTKIKGYAQGSFDQSIYRNMAIFQFLMKQYPKTLKVEFIHIKNLISPHWGGGQLNFLKLLLQHYKLSKKELQEVIDLAKYSSCSFAYDYLVSLQKH